MKLLIMLVIVGLLTAVTFDYRLGDTETVSNAIVRVNRITVDAMLDSLVANIDRHRVKTDYHEKGDENSKMLQSYATNLRDATIYFNNIVDYLTTHFANDTAHVNPDITTTLPEKWINTSQIPPLELFEIMVDSLKKSITAHKANKQDGRHYYLAKDLRARYIAHLADDAAHKEADLNAIHSVAVLDTTNIDSLALFCNRFTKAYNLHRVEKDDLHNAADTLNVLDSLRSTRRKDIYAWLNAAKSALTKHQQDGGTSKIHVEADTDTVTTANVVTGVHIAADEATHIYDGHYVYMIPTTVKRVTATVTASGITTGGSVVFYGSLDSQNWVRQDSLAVSANGTTAKYLNTNYWKYFKAYLNTRTDGTYTIKFTGGE